MTHESTKAGPGKYRSSVTRLTATCSTIELPDHRSTGACPPVYCVAEGFFRLFYAVDSPSSVPSVS